MEKVKLTEEEKSVLNHLAAAWNVFAGMSQDHGQEAVEFAALINQLEAVIGMRVARRVDPEVWRVAVASREGD